MTRSSGSIVGSGLARYLKQRRALDEVVQAANNVIDQWREMGFIDVQQAINELDSTLRHHGLRDEQAVF